MAKRHLWIAIALSIGACGSTDRETPAAQAPPQPAVEAPRPTSPTAQPAANAALADDLPNGLVLAYSQFPVGPDGRIVPQPGAAIAEILVRRGGEWQIESTIEDASSNVFHKAMVYDPPNGEPGILTLGGTAAAVKLWRRTGGQWRAETLWQTEFGGRFNRMRDAEVADLYGDGRAAIAVATHDQGVVAAVRQNADNTFAATELDRQANMFVHEIELGDLDGDGAIEIYATPSEPNDLDGGEQRGQVVRYVPRRNQGRTVVADLGNRHAKEIYVGDVDGDGRDELYVAVEALTRGTDPNVEIVEGVEIRRYDANTAPNAGVVVARLNDRLTRFLTVGDFDGDGKREMVAAAFSTGLWLLRPGRDPRAEWGIERIDPNSSGFEHASIAADLDDNGTHELYVAADEQGELRRYTWVNGRPRREVIHRRDVARSRMTWNLMPVPVRLLGR